MGRRQFDFSDENCHVQMCNTETSILIISGKKINWREKTQTNPKK